MKRAVGELSSAVIVGFSVAILIAFFYYTVWPVIDNNFKSQTSCDKAVCNIQKDSSGRVITNEGKVECKVPLKDGTLSDEIIYCNYKG